MIPSEPRRILFLHSGGLGDGILSLPAVYSIRSAFPEATITLIGHPERWRWIHPSPFEKILPLEQMSLQRLFILSGDIPPALATLFREQHLVISWHGNAAFEKNLHSLVRGTLLFHPFHPSTLKVHASDFFLDTLRSLDIPQIREIPSLEAPPVRDLLPEDARSMVIIHPGSGSPKKCWAPGNFARLAEGMEHLRNRSCRFLIGEADRWILEDPLFRAAGMERVLLRDLSLPSVAAVLKNAIAYVGNDSGISHMAAALQVPSVVLFMTTEPRIWRPLGDHVRVLHKPVEEMTVGTVLNGLERILS